MGILNSPVITSVFIFKQKRLVFRRLYVHHKTADVSTYVFVCWK